MKATQIRGRDYQVAASEAVFKEFASGRSATLCVMPTGTGKTVLAAMMAQHAWEEFGWRTLFLAERRTLIRQAHQSLSSFGLKCAVEMGLESAKKHASKHGTAQVVIATPQTLNGERLQSWDSGHFGLLVQDECHRALSDMNRRVHTYFAHARHVGITATPERGDGQSLMRVYKSLAYRLRLGEAIKKSVLVPYDIQVCPISVDLRKIKMSKGDLNIGDLVERIGPKIEVICRAIEKVIGDRQGVIFTPDQASAAAVANVLTQLGVRAKYVAGSGGKFGMSEKDQRSVLKEYNQLRIQVVVCAELLIEGWDNTATSFVGNLKPTVKLGRFTQMLGRGLRPCDPIGKLDCLFLDMDWLCDESSRDLVTAVDLHDDGEEPLPPPVKKEANRILREGGKSVEEAIEEAANRIRSRPVVDIRLTGQREKFVLYRRDPRGVCQILGMPAMKGHDFDWRGNNPATSGQKGYLGVLGVEDTDRISKWGAAKLIKELKPRHAAGLASPRQVQELLCLGVHEDLARGMTADAARRVIAEQTRIKATCPS